MNLSRRSFVAASGATAALAAAGASVALADETAQGEAYVVESFDADETIDADIVVMGAGISGISAALQAADLGMNVVVLEASGITGGNGRFTEGIGGVDSRMAQEQGVHVDTADIIHDELEFFNYRVNALFWIDAINNSGDNIDWMQDNGAVFEGVVDNDRGDGKVTTYHWFKDRVGGEALDPMLESAEEKGATVLLNTRGVKLVMRDGRVCGLVAEREDGSTLLVNAQAVVFASGGYAANYDLMLERGCPTVFYSKGMETNRGDALLMAQAAGGVNITPNSALLFSVTMPALDFLEAFAFQRFGEALIVNASGERFTDENCGATAIGCFLNALSQQDEDMFVVLAKNTIDLLDTYPVNGSYEGFGEKVVSVCKGIELETGAKNNVGADPTVLGNLNGAELPEKVAFYGDTVEDLAQECGIDPDALVATVNRYNELCEGGSDLDFGKDASKMMALDGAEGYYALRIYPGYATSIGGIKTNRNYQVVDRRNQPIEGLYAVGCDGIMTYRETYTVEVPGSCNMHNVNSARTAVKHAFENLA